MVRLEILGSPTKPPLENVFTFQYGQIRNNIDEDAISKTSKIYIPVWLDQKFINFVNVSETKRVFTFQYGQIRNTLQVIVFGSF